MTCPLQPLCVLFFLYLWCFFLLQPFLVNSAVAPFPIPAHLLQNEHSSGAQHHPHSATRILEGCMGTCLWWLKIPLRTLSVWKHIHKWTQLWYYKLHSLHSRLPSLDLVRCGEEVFLDQWKNSVIIHFSCFPWSFRPLGVCRLPSSPVPSFF